MLRPSPRRFVHIFDRALKRHHRERAALDPGHEQYNYLRDEVASRLVERLDDIDASYAFPRAVDIGAGTGHVRRALARGESGVESLLELDGAAAMRVSSAADASAAEPRRLRWRSGRWMRRSSSSSPSLAT